MLRAVDAKNIARAWVTAEASHLPGFQGAYFAGSVSGLADEALVPPSSDVDLNLVFSERDSPIPRGKRVHQGVLLDVTSLALDDLRQPEQVLGDYHLAGGFRTPGIILDPSGHLTALQASVGRQFAQREWVVRRCEHARGRILEQLDGLARGQATLVPDQVIGWLFPTGVTTHVLLAAGLRNPTVRTRYVVAGELLAEYGRLDVYRRLLELLGSAGLSRTRVERHLPALSQMFDAAAAAIATPFPFATDISQPARPIAIDGSRALIESGRHREAVFWMLVTSARCALVLAADGPAATRERFEPAWRALLADVGITSAADLRRRAEEVRAFVPHLWPVALDIVAANPLVTG